MVDLTIRQVIEKILNGQIRVPAFQRGFVWEANRVAYLMDSIYKGYPFGSILLWRTKERLKFERKLGPFKLPDSEPGFPMDYILDGQQRITSIFGVFQTELEQSSNEDWMKIYFDYNANQSVQESQFFALLDEEVDNSRHFLLRNIFDTTAYRKATRDLPEHIAEKVDAMQSVFKEARIPIQLIETDQRSTVAIVFERVNQRGVELDNLQLMSAWTWSEDFDLQNKFQELSNELKPFGFSDVGQDSNLLLRCCSGVLAGKSDSSSLVSLTGGTVRDRFREITNGITGAIDFLRNELKVYSLENLPSNHILVPLTVFFSIEGNKQFRYNDKQRRSLVRWFWRICFSRRYNSQPIKSLQEDIEQILRLKNSQENRLGDFVCNIDESYFSQQDFRANTIATKTFILMLAQQNPKSFITGQSVSLSDVLKEYNKNEFHHIYPQRFLKDIYGDGNFPYSVNCLSNFAFLSKTDNNRIKDTKPSEYIKLFPENKEEIMECAVIEEAMFNDNFPEFIKLRSEKLLQIAINLIK